VASRFTQLKRRIFPKKMPQQIPPPIIQTQVIKEFDHAQFVDAICDVCERSGKPISNRDELVKGLESGALSRHQAIDAVLEGIELFRTYSIDRDARLIPFINDQVRADSQALLGWKHVDLARLEEAAGGLRGLEYYELHKWRVLEMVNALGYMASKRPVTEVLEVGSVFSTKLIKDIFPAIQISTVDKYEHNEIGYLGVYSIKETTKEHFNVDLLIDDLSQMHLRPDQPFDVVLLCEVIEHLLIHPRKIMEFLFKHLNAGGYLYLTTPNAFDRHKVHRFQKHDNPIPLYPYEYSFSDAHMHHVREFGLSEMLEACRDAGFEIAAFYFSACWETQKDVGSFDDDRLSNLVILARKPLAAQATS
jgi:SAM-dependent methyltransferase